MEKRRLRARIDGRIIIHFDYDCFYASVFEAKNPSLKSLPFAVQQKQIIVTCNYEARRRGLRKLQLVKDARRICPEVVVELGEDISRFRDASKELYQLIKSFSWNGKVERLGFDEVWCDVTDVVNWNRDTCNRNHLEQSFFQTSKDDPTVGFEYDASTISGHTYPKDYTFDSSKPVDELTLRLRLGSHLALHMRHQLEQEKGYTSTVGIATSKLLSKLVGKLNKPKGQTTVMPPFSCTDERPSNVNRFMDGHEIGKVPGIGFKTAQKLREFSLQRPAAFDSGLIYGRTKESVTVADLRNHPDANPERFEKLLAGPGSPHGIGDKIWCLLNGVDDTEVKAARDIPRQISIEDSYICLDSMPELLKELSVLAQSLLIRMRIDLLATDDDVFEAADAAARHAKQRAEIKDPSTVPDQKWLARPRTLRLTTRPRQPLLADGTRIRSFKRISHSGPLPKFVFNLGDSIETLAEWLVEESLIGMFRKLHPKKAGWNLSLVNLAVTNMAETAGDSKNANGRDIGSMFKKQQDVLRDFTIIDTSPIQSLDVAEGGDAWLHAEDGSVTGHQSGSDISAETADRIEEPGNIMFDTEEVLAWDDGEGEDEMHECCERCGLRVPSFAIRAHQRFHLHPTS